MKRRVLKFRAYHTERKEWLFGYKSPQLGGFNLVGEVTLMGELASVPLDQWEVIDVMQYTGNKDLKGVEIYEGDIYHMGENIGSGNNILYVVEFNDCGLRGRQITNRSTAGIDFFLKHIRVIGNIHDNPELLK